MDFAAYETTTRASVYELRRAVMSCHDAVKSLPHLQPFSRLAPDCLRTGSRYFTR